MPDVIPIGLTGRARAGKDTVAGILAAELSDRKVIRQGFADKLKISAARALGFEVDDPQEAINLMNALKVNGCIETIGGGIGRNITGREYLQRYGTEAHRDVFGDDFWLDAVLPVGRDDCDVLLIPDVRFPNEAERVRERGGLVVQVVREAAEKVEAHSSEAGIPPHLVDVTLINDGTLDELRRRVAKGLRLWDVVPELAA